MSFNQEMFEEFIKKLENKAIDRNGAIKLGKYYPLYNRRIRHAMSIDYSMDVDSISIKDYYKINDKPDNIGLSQITINPIFRYNDSACHSWDPQFFKYEFSEYLKKFEINDINSLIYLYNRCYVFLNKYLIYYQSQDINILSITSYLISNVIYPVFKAADTLYQYMYDEHTYFIYNKIFIHINELVDLCSRQCSPSLIDDFTYSLFTFYNHYNLDTSILIDNVNGRDIFLTQFIETYKVYFGCKIANDIRESMKNIVLSHQIKDIPLVEKSKLYSESVEDSSFTKDNITGESYSDITIFGDNKIAESITTSGLNNFKKDLFCFNSNFVKKYIECSETTRINFIINDQFKMYLQSELNCPLLVANVRTSNETNMFTILKYENDVFVLFTISDKPDTVFGLSINEEKNTLERKLISIDRDEDLSFQLIINIDNE